MDPGLKIAVALLILMLVPSARAKRPITFEDLVSMKRISDPQVSPNGKWVAYVETRVDVEANKGTSHIWLVPAAGGTPRELTHGQDSDTRPRWSPDSQSLAFISSRGGTSQIWILPLNGGEARQLTSISTQAEGVTWAAKSDSLLFVSQVYSDCGDDDCNRRRLEEAAKSKVRARIIDSLLYRHWMEWREGKYTHLFVVSARAGTPRDVTPRSYDAPTYFLGAPDGYAISPDGTEVCYTSNRAVPPSAVAWTTNNDLYLASVAEGSSAPTRSQNIAAAEAKNITADNPGSDAAPRFSPDGRYIAYTSQARNGYESDLFRLRVYDRQTRQIKELTPGFDQWVGSFDWAADSNTIYFTAPDHTEQPVFKTSVNDPGVEKVLDGYNDDLHSTADGRALVLTRQSLTQPPEIYAAVLPGEVAGAASSPQGTPSGAPLPLTRANADRLPEIELKPRELVMTKGALGARIQSLLVKPPGFDPSKKYPALVLIHGGPQSAWDNAWSYRWNAQMFASHGYVVMMTNFHGSTGYGQRFVEEISRDWGGAPYQDLMLATDYLESLPYVDRTRIGAAGASFGGYMIDWIAGHSHRFKVLVSHDGVYDNRSMYGETEELWFPEWELKGMPWETSSLYEKWSPSAFVQNIQTPMLIAEGELDFRVPQGQAFAIFAALQRRGVPSKLLYFPDEGHWVLKAQNSRLWYKTVLGWLDEYLKP